MKRSYSHLNTEHHRPNNYFGSLMNKSISPVFRKDTNPLVRMVLDLAEVTFNEIRKTINKLSQYQNPLQER